MTSTVNQSTDRQQHQNIISNYGYVKAVSHYN